MTDLEFDSEQKEKLEWLLKEINTAIEPKKYLAEKSIYPPIFIVGVPRSGTTLLSQWMVNLNLFCYPTNFISRFYSNPYIGSLIQEMLVNETYQYKNEFNIKVINEDFVSRVGKTTGLLAPHEFWYFWKNFFPINNFPVEKEEFKKNSRIKPFVENIFKMQNFYQRPFFMKAMVMNWYIEFLYEMIPNALFIYIKRDPINIMESILKVEQQHESYKECWNFLRPAEYNILETFSETRRVAGHVELIRRDVESQLRKIPSDNQVHIDYEDFCMSPDILYQKLRKKLKGLDYALPVICPIDTNFSITLSAGGNRSSFVEEQKYIRDFFNLS